MVPSIVLCSSSNLVLHPAARLGENSKGTQRPAEKRLGLELLKVAVRDFRVQLVLQLLCAVSLYVGGFSPLKQVYIKQMHRNFMLDLLFRPSERQDDTKINKLHLGRQPGWE